MSAAPALVCDRSAGPARAFDAHRLGKNARVNVHLLYAACALIFLHEFARIAISDALANSAALTPSAVLLSSAAASRSRCGFGSACEEHRAAGRASSVESTP